MMRFIPSKAKITAFALAVFYAAFWWLRRDAKQDGEVENTLKAMKQDQKNAKQISDRVADSRRDDERLHDYKGHGYRK